MKISTPNHGLLNLPNAQAPALRNKGTLPETNSSHLKMDGWNTTFLLGLPIFRGYVSFREGNNANKLPIRSHFWGGGTLGGR